MNIETESHKVMYNKTSRYTQVTKILCLLSHLVLFIFMIWNIVFWLFHTFFSLSLSLFHCWLCMCVCHEMVRSVRIDKIYGWMNISMFKSWHFIFQVLFWFLFCFFPFVRGFFFISLFASQTFVFYLFVSWAYD